MPSLSKIMIVLTCVALAACGQKPGDAGTGGLPPAGMGPDAGVVGSFPPNSPEFFTQTVGDRVLFAVDQHTLDASAIAVLNAQADWLLSNPNYNITIEGHADEQGTREYNLALGARRAQSVENYLLSKGVALTRMRTLSYGKERPIEVCSVEACYAQNRRAVTVLAGGIG